MNKQTALIEFGYNFLGPICSEYFFHLRQYILNNKPSCILFLAREGYFFKSVYDQLVEDKQIDELPNYYIYVSRTFLFRITITHKNARSLSLNTNFSGTMQKLLINRFGFSLRQLESVFSPQELQREWVLPEQQTALDAFLNSYSTQLETLVASSRIAYLHYLQSFKLNTNSLPLMVDVGYSGTIQKLVTQLLECNSLGLYFITTRQGDYKINRNIASMSPVFKDDVVMGGGYTMLDRSLLLESLLTAPQGQFIDIEKSSCESLSPYNFYFGKQVYAQRNFHELQQVFEGALANIKHNFKYDIRFTVEEIEELFDCYAHKLHFYPKAVRPMFDVDDTVSGNSKVNALQLFRI